MYDAYYVEDFTNLDKDKEDDIASWQCDCMVTVAALGFGDIPTKAFIEAYNVIKTEGWVAFNIKEYSYYNIISQYFKEKRNPPSLYLSRIQK